MSLVTMRELLQDARKRKYAVGGFNVFNFETLGAVVETAEELKTPLVLGVPERLFKFADVDILSAAMVRASQKSSVPIALHLDHAHSYEGVMRAIRWGFTSVMYDGSTLPFQENIKRTKEIVRVAHSLGISVEGELGYSGLRDGNEINEENMVQPEEAAEFANKTKVDALAVAVGNHHGGYRGGPDIGFARLAEIKSVVAVPLVLHGGSRLGKEDCTRLIDSGISKINITTNLSIAASEKLRAELDRNPQANYINLVSAVRKGVKDTVRKYMLYFDCISKAL